MSALSLTPEIIAELRARHAAFLAERLVSDRARAELGRLVEEGYEYALTLPLRQLIVPEVVVGAAARALTKESVRGHLAPIAAEVARHVVTALQTETTKLGDYVPDPARQAIERIVARPDLVPEELIRKIFDAEATEEMMRDVLYDALVEFNESVNPFFADWGLPMLIKQFLPIGSGAVLKSMSSVKAAFDKRLEPEIRKFLLGFSRQAKKKLADFVVAGASDKKLIAVRQSVVAFFYDETLKQVTQNVDEALRKDVESAAVGIVLEVLSHDHARARVIAELDAFLKEHGDETLGAWLTRIGATERPAHAALAELLWPFVKLVVASPPVRAYLEELTGEFYETLGA